jgi:hypothetical protein
MEGIGVRIEALSKRVRNFLLTVMIVSDFLVAEIWGKGPAPVAGLPMLTS